MHITHVVGMYYTNLIKYQPEAASIWSLVYMTAECGHNKQVTRMLLVGSNYR